MSRRHGLPGTFPRSKQPQILEPFNDSGHKPRRCLSRHLRLILASAPVSPPSTQSRRLVNIQRLWPNLLELPRGLLVTPPTISPRAVECGHRKLTSDARAPNARSDDDGQKAAHATTQDKADRIPSAQSQSVASDTSNSSPNPDPAIYNPFDSDWTDAKDGSIQSFADLPHRLFGANQHMVIDMEFKETLRLLLRQFTAPVVYCFAYGSGVFPQAQPSGPNGSSVGSSGGYRTATEAEFRAVHPKPPPALLRAQQGNPKMIDFIFGVTHTQHWHSINMRQHPDHYSGIASIGSGAVAHVQNRWGAGVYFHPYVVVNGVLIKYGVTSIDNLVTDLSTWDTLYLAGRLHKPVKILRDHPRVRVANQYNLIAALRASLLLLPEEFSERELYSTITGLSYIGDPRMSVPAESPAKVANIVDANIGHFRRLYAPLVQTLPNVDFVGPNADPDRLSDSSWIMNPTANLDLVQDMSPTKRANMIRRLPSAFRSRLYFQYQKRFGMTVEEIDIAIRSSADVDAQGSVKRRQAGELDRRIAGDDRQALHDAVRRVIGNTVQWPATTQSVKGLLTAGLWRTLRYLRDKVAKWRGATKPESASR